MPMSTCFRGAKFVYFIEYYIGMGVLTRLTKRPKAKELVLAVYRVARRDTAEVMDDCLLLSYGSGCRRCHVGIQKKRGLFTGCSFRRSGALTKPFSLGKEQHAEAHAVIVITSLPAPWQGGVSGGDGVLQTHRRSTVAISLTAMMEICQISERQE